ncbi:MAG TPA: class F sortase, partial [Roseiflexaceae bacterium]|nr:class F sortase [Roseiflexaceae bacterium]
PRPQPDPPAQPDPPPPVPAPPPLTPPAPFPPDPPLSPTPPLFLAPTLRPDQPTVTPDVTETATITPTGTITPTVAPSGASEGVALTVSLPTRLMIQAISLDVRPVAVGLDRNRVPVVPDHDVGWYIYGAAPGQGENIVLWGHVLRFRSTPGIPAPFARLRELEPGATVTIYDAAANPHRYVVTHQKWVTPDQIDVMLPQGREMLTLISCIGDRVVSERGVDLTHRLITIAEPER